MTCKEKYVNDHPGCDIDAVIAAYCPSYLGYLPDPRNCDAATDTEAMSCEACWNRELPEDEDAKTNVISKCYTDGTEHIVRGKRAKIDVLDECSGYDIPVIPPFSKPHIKDSGNRREFETGAVRDIQEGKGRCDLMPLDVVAEFVSVAIGSSAHTVLHNIDGFKETGDEYFLYNALKKHPWRGLIDEERPGINYAPTCTMFLEVAKHFEEGAKKYGENNWQKGIPVHCYIDSAVRHYLKYLRGDKDEPHDRAFVWNIMCCIWTCIHKPELNEYRKDDKNGT
jgi:hypothetical protein